MFGLIGSIERSTLASNVKMSMNAKARSGEAITGRVLGYKLSLNPLTQKNDLVIDENEAHIVREIFDLYLNHNKGLKAITTILNQKDIAPLIKTIFSVCVKYILNNPVYKGYVRFNNHQNWAVQRRSGKSDKNDVILVKGKHEAIISEDVFDQVHEKLASKVLNRDDLLVEISTYVALLNAQNAEIIWYVDGRIIKRKVQRTDNQTLLHLFIIQPLRKFCLS